ncbi:hypothetical protein BCR44DRAFT_1430996 [Catenaria anguillulae PL171]|uniref:Uncharacterized protein n=1 Tax=Catenaria anguillulae PL171 TaxID=765915 RepID=A0A1Y2HRZ8_9FUNG|nr:hypothetical protein BCR44DRAFT_1430996 [Catenaria anguillulae PL171]
MPAVRDSYTRVQPPHHPHGQLPSPTTCRTQTKSKPESTLSQPLYQFRGRGVTPRRADRQGVSGM